MELSSSALDETNRGTCYSLRADLEGVEIQSGGGT